MGNQNKKNITPLAAWVRTHCKFARSNKPTSDTNVASWVRENCRFQRHGALTRIQP